MLTVPWKVANDQSRPETIVQVSRLELARARDVPGFLVAALRLRHAALNTPGAVGLSLQAAPFRKTFWTLSSWHDHESITAFMRSDAHRAVMAKYRHRMAESHFHTWTSHERVGRPPNWDDARRRYDASTTTT